MFETVFPIITTPDLRRALGFYRRLLGGVVSYSFPADTSPVYVGLGIGDAHLGIAEDPSAAGAGSAIALWAYVDDCDAAVARMAAAGVEVVEPPADQPWGERVARVRDPDGNLVMIGQRS